MAQCWGPARGARWGICSSQPSQAMVASLLQERRVQGEGVGLPLARAQPPPAGDWRASAGLPARQASLLHSFKSRYVQMQGV